MNSGNSSAEFDEEALWKTLRAIGKKVLEEKRNDTTKAPEESDIHYRIAVAGLILGFVSILLNILVLVILLCNRRQAFKHVFYILILSFVIIDCLKGCGLVVASADTVLDSSVLLDKFVRMRMKQINLFILKFCNLATILNVLLITLNEFSFIKFPLKYHTYITRLRTIVMLVIAWTATMGFTVTSNLVKGGDSTLYVIDCNKTDTLPKDVQIISTSTICYYREPPGSIGLASILNLTVIGFCILCLAVVLTCYTIMFVVISRIQKQDAQLYASSEVSRKLSQHRRSSEMSTDLHITPSSVSCGSTNYAGDERKAKRQVLRRYKYVLVIGVVILVYMLYLISYTIMQFLQEYRILDRNQNSWSKGRNSNIIQWSMQLLVGLHAVIQPLCYFRITEFRRFLTRTFNIKRLRHPLLLPPTHSQQINSENATFQLNCEAQLLENGRVSARKLSESNLASARSLKPDNIRLTRNPYSSSNLKSDQVNRAQHRKLSVQFSSRVEFQTEFQEEGLM